METIIFYSLGCVTTLVLGTSYYLFAFVKRTKSKIKSLEIELENARRGNEYLSNIISNDRKELLEIINRESQNYYQVIKDSNETLDRRLDDIYRVMDKRFENINTNLTH
jgi:hypothetical protein